MVFTCVSKLAMKPSLVSVLMLSLVGVTTITITGAAIPSSLGQAHLGNNQPLLIPASFRQLAPPHRVPQPNQPQNVAQNVAQDILINPEDIQFETPGVPQQVGALIVQQIRAQLGNKPILLSELNRRNISIAAELPAVQINRTFVRTSEETLVNKTTRLTNNGGSNYVTTSYLPPPPPPQPAAPVAYPEPSKPPAYAPQTQAYAPQTQAAPRPYSPAPAYSPKVETSYQQQPASYENVNKAPGTAANYASKAPAVPAYPTSNSYAPPPNNIQYSSPAPAYKAPQDSKTIVKYIEVCNGQQQYQLPMLPNLELYNDKIQGVPELKQSLQLGYQQLINVYNEIQKNLAELKQIQEHLGEVGNAQNDYQQALASYHQIASHSNGLYQLGDNAYGSSYPLPPVYAENVYPSAPEYSPSPYQAPYASQESYAKANNAYDGNKIQVAYHKTEELLNTNNTVAQYYK